MVFMQRENALTYAEEDHSAVAIPMISAITPPVAELVMVSTRLVTRP